MANLFHETRSIALITSAGNTVLLAILLFIVRWFFVPIEAWIIIVICTLVFFSGYFFFKYAVDEFIYKKIKLIYKTIHSFRSVKGSETTSSGKSESLDSVNQAVIDWGARQKMEIDELKKLAAYRREFLGNISHELKTPIFNIQGYVLTLLDGGLEDVTINRNYLMRTEQSVNRMIAIVKDLEEISKLESGELKLNLQRVDLTELAREVVDFLEMKARKVNVVLSIENKTDGQVLVRADKERIRQVLINLIENAIKYADKEDNRIVVKFFDMDENYLIEIKDNGPGIAEENLTRIFERFYRTDKGRSRDKGGTGLGLAIVKHIIEAHDKTITVRSKVHQGTTFSFTLAKK
ncbi:MAG: GHKL domain-containing protein [Bacteroidales bacterium]|nr:GHKL domain-containing protein [Bacteroidales bacterium]